MTTRGACWRVRPYAASLAKSKEGHEHVWRGCWRLEPSQTFGCLRPTDWKACAATGWDSSAFASMTNGASAFFGLSKAL